jgi:hypothetical protein
MTNIQITGGLAAAAYAAVLAVGLTTGEIIMPPVFSIKREDDSDSFWMAVVVDALIALWALATALR